MLNSVWKGSEIRNQNMEELLSCYISIFIYAMNNLDVNNSSKNEINESWIRLFTKPFQEYIEGKVSNKKIKKKRKILIFFISFLPQMLVINF